MTMDCIVVNCPYQLLCLCMDSCRVVSLYTEPVIEQRCTSLLQVEYSHNILGLRMGMNVYRASSCCRNTILNVYGTVPTGHCGAAVGCYRLSRHVSVVEIVCGNGEVLPNFWKCMS